MSTSLEEMAVTPGLDSRAERQAAAEERVAAALHSIEQAQRLLGQAAEALCSVRGLAAQWRRLGALSAQARRAFYDVQGKADSLALRGGLLIDHAADAYAERRTARRRP